jgi:hypothetical protein
MCLANVPIPYTVAAPAAPTGLNVAPTSIGSANLTLSWSGTPYTNPNTDAFVGTRLRVKVGFPSDNRS